MSKILITQPDSNVNTFNKTALWFEAEPFKVNLTKMGPKELSHPNPERLTHTGRFSALYFTLLSGSQADSFFFI